jgi:hypothetical protein
MSNPDKTPIDIHNPPPADADPLVWMEYRHAVERAAIVDKKPVEERGTYDVWREPRHDASVFDWLDSTYRIAPPAPDPLDAVAPGHNPERWTVRILMEGKAKIGASLRVMDSEEVRGLRGAGSNTIYARAIGGKWLDQPHGTLLDGITYATTQPPGYFLPKSAPVKRIVPFTAATFPKGEVWVRREGWADGARSLVVAVCEDHILAGQSLRVNFKTGKGMKHSLDGGNTWLPWGVEVES